VLNLLSNAIKFTPQGGLIKIGIGWSMSGGQYVSVRDSGPGIPEERDSPHHVLVRKMLGPRTDAGTGEKPV
jgi:K+-sensing histidine kinase KdpD